MMKDRLNSAVYDVKRSAIREFSRMAKETPGCIGLTLGEPDFDTPISVRDAAKLALDAGETHYIENNGTAALREAIAEYVSDHDIMEDFFLVHYVAAEGKFVPYFQIFDDYMAYTNEKNLNYQKFVTMLKKFLEKKNLKTARKWVKNEKTERTQNSTSVLGIRAAEISDAIL